jgi:hypothetical protein
LKYSSGLQEHTLSPPNSYHIPFLREAPTLRREAMPEMEIRHYQQQYDEKETCVPVNAVKRLDLFVTTMLPEVLVQVVLPLVRNDALSRKGIDVVLYVGQEYIQTTQLSF